MSDEWISGPDAAAIIGVSRNTIYLTLKDPAERARMWGDERVGWRRKPGVRRTIYQVSRRRAEKIAAGDADTGPDEPSP